MALQVENRVNAIHFPEWKDTSEKPVLSVPSERPAAGLWQLLQRASRSASQMQIYPSGSTYVESQPIDTSYKALLEDAENKALALRKAISYTSQDKIVLLHFDEHTLNVTWLWAVIRAGFIPAISTPFSADEHQRQDHIRHLKNLLKDPVLLTTKSTLNQYPETSFLSTQIVEELETGTNEGLKLPPLATDENPKRPAAIMLTSGSTGKAKAVALTDEQITSSIAGKSESWNTNSSSVFFNWIGFDHVANLAEVHLHAMLLGAQQIHVQANDLLAQPLLFLHLLSKHHVTHTFAPNFFLSILEKRLMSCSPSDPVFSVDLSRLRSIMSGGEANLVSTAERMSELLTRLGTQGQVLRPGYGLTESCAALMYGMLDLPYEKSEKHEFASIGKPITGARARVSKDDGSLAETHEIGNLELSGPVVFKEYYNDAEATKKAFTPDGWYVTGDRAYVDASGKFNMVGRTKEVIVINGVKYFPVDIEAAIEKACLPGILPSYVAAFAHRPQGSPTESYCIVYASMTSTDESLSTIDTISHITSRIVGARPKWVIPLLRNRLEKSALGKLSRTKIQAQFDAGSFDDEKIDVTYATRQVALANRVPPQTDTEIALVKVLSEILEIPDDEISVDRTVFEIGITSTGLFPFEKSLRQELNLGTEVSVITFLSNPIIRSIATAIDNKASHSYDPVVQLQAHGSKNPLWLVHPASGNVLAFLPLARVVTDRPLYALTARGLSNNEQLFSSISEMSDTYFTHVKKTQPNGPYALTGYSLGTTVAFELAKRLEANGDTVAFCAALDSPPHVIPLIQDLDWAAAAVLVSYFLQLILQDSVPELIKRFRGLSKPDLIQSILDVSIPEQKALLNLDVHQLLAIANVTDNFGNMARTYHPQGSVNKVDVFYCTPLHSVESSGREKWITDFLSKWQDFSRGQISYHECDGDHADMLNPQYVEGFEKKLALVLQSRGI